MIFLFRFTRPDPTPWLLLMGSWYANSLSLHLHFVHTSSRLLLSRDDITHHNCRNVYVKLVHCIELLVQDGTFRIPLHINWHSSVIGLRTSIWMSFNNLLKVRFSPPFHHLSLTEIKITSLLLVMNMSYLVTWWPFAMLHKALFNYFVIEKEQVVGQFTSSLISHVAVACNTPPLVIQVFRLF